jgi:hypothetical protein
MLECGIFIRQGAYPESPSYHKKIAVGAAFSREVNNDRG